MGRMPTNGNSTMQINPLKLLNPVNVGAPDEPDGPVACREIEVPSYSPAATVSDSRARCRLFIQNDRAKMTSSDT